MNDAILTAIASIPPYNYETYYPYCHTNSSLKSKHCNLLMYIIIYFSADMEDVLKIHLENYPKELEQTNKAGFTAIEIAARNIDTPAGLRAFKILLDAGANLESKNPKNIPLLSVIVMYAKNDYGLQAMQLLMDKENINIEQQERYGFTPLLYAARRAKCTNSMNVLRLIVSRGADINHKSKSGRTALFIACENVNRLDAIRFLIESGASVNSCNDTHATPLMNLCCKVNHPDVLDAINLLLDRGANIDSQNQNGQTALMLISKYYGAKYSFEATELLLNRGAQIDAFCSSGWTKLIYACSYVNSEDGIRIIKLLIDRGANVNHETKIKHTALTKAARYAKNDFGLNTMRLLIQAGADVNARTSTNCTALTYACEHLFESSIEALEILLDHGADINVMNNKGNTALSFAFNHIVRCDTKAVIFLLNRGADVNIGEHSLSIAIRHPHLELVQLLVMRGVKVRSEDIYVANRPLDYIDQENEDIRMKIFQFLLKYAVLDLFLNPYDLRSLKPEYRKILRRNYLQYEFAVKAKREADGLINRVQNIILYQPDSLRSQLICARNCISPETYALWLREKPTLLKYLDIMDYDTFQFKINDIMSHMD